MYVNKISVFGHYICKADTSPNVNNSNCGGINSWVNEVWILFRIKVVYYGPAINKGMIEEIKIIWPRTSCLDFKQKTKKQLKLVPLATLYQHKPVYISSVHIILDLEYNSTCIHVSHFFFANYKQPN